jgi:hypothetical protein
MIYQATITHVQSLNNDVFQTYQAGKSQYARKTDGSNAKDGAAFI